MRRLWRLLGILRVVCKYRLERLLAKEPRVPRTLRCLLICAAPLHGLGSRKMPLGERARRALEELGPIFIKFGQTLSTRPDLLPPEVVEELSCLQDRVPPFPQKQALATLRAALQQDPAEVFASFEEQPLASASIAQVYAATLHDGRRVVVKITRPDIAKRIQRDIALLYLLGRLIALWAPFRERLRPLEVIADYEQVLLNELDLELEAANTAQLRRNFQNSKKLYVPEICWDLSHKNVLVMERVEGVAITDLEALKAHGTDLRALTEDGVEVFFTQVFRHNFFHADMHPGNIFVSLKDPRSPCYIVVDCAIIGTLTEHDRYYLARNLLAVVQRRYHEVAALHVECGWVPPNTRVHELEQAVRNVCEPLLAKPLAQISCARLLVKLLGVARRFGMTVQPSLVLLQKTLLNIEGLGRRLYPQLDLLSTLRPLLEEWLLEYYTPRRLLARLGSRLSALSVPAPAPSPPPAAATLHHPPPAPHPHGAGAAPKSPPSRLRSLLPALLLAAAAVWIAEPSWEGLREVPGATWLLLLAALWLLRR